MAAKTSVGSLLVISLLTLYATTTVATFINPLTIPSCVNPVNPAKCYIDYKAAYAAAVSSELNAASNAIGMACNAANAAKYSCNLAFQFFKSVSGSFGGPFIQCQHSFSIAVNYLGQATKTMEGKTNLSRTEVISVQKSIQFAATNVMQCNASNQNPVAKVQTSQPANLCNIAVNFSKMLSH